MTTPPRTLRRLGVALTAAALTLTGTIAVSTPAHAAPRWTTTTTSAAVDRVLRTADGTVDRVTVRSTSKSWVADIRTKRPGKAEKRTRISGKGSGWDAVTLIEGSDGSAAIVSTPRDYLKAPAKVWTRARGSATWTYRAAPARTADSSVTPGIDIAKNGTLTLAYMTGDKVVTSTLARGGRWTTPRTALLSTDLKNLAYGDAFLTLDVAPDGSADLLYALSGVALTEGYVCEVRLVTRARTSSSFTGTKRFGKPADACNATMVRAGSKTVVATMANNRSQLHVRATPSSAWRTTLKTSGYIELTGSGNGRVTALASHPEKARLYVLGAGRDTSFAKARFTTPGNASITQDAKGRVLLRYATAPKNDPLRRDITVRVSTPAGTTWSKPRILGAVSVEDYFPIDASIGEIDGAGSGKFVVTWPKKIGADATRVAVRN